MRPRQLPLFRLFGFQVQLDLSWLLLALLITWTLAAGVFPFEYPDLPNETYWWMGMAGAIGILFSIVLHEMSHSLVARYFGLRIRAITLFIFGGVAEMEDEPPSPKAEFLIAIAGPVASFVLAFIFQQIHILAAAIGWHTAIVGVTYYLAYLNMVLAVFNLVPAFPLDGGRMLRALLWGWRQDLRKATRIASQLGSGFGLALMVLGLLSFLQGLFIGGMWWFLIGVFVRFAAATSYKQVLVREVLHGVPISRFMNPNPVTVSPEISIQELVDDYIYTHHFKMFPVLEDSALLGCITTSEVKHVPRERWAQRTVGELTVRCSSENTVAPETDTMEVLSLMTRPDGKRRFMVVDDERLVGVVSLTDLREFISLKLELEPPRR